MKNCTTGWILMLKNVEIFFKYVKNFLVIIKMLYRNPKLFLCMPHLKIIEKLLLKHAHLGNHSIAFVA